MNTVPGDMERPLTEHLTELRSGMVRVLIPVIILTMVFFIFSGDLLQLMWRQVIPPNMPFSLQMNIYSPMELIITRFKLSIMFAFFFGIPLMIYETFKFIGKGLYENEKLFFIKIVPFSFILFTVGALIAYFLVVPMLFKFTIFYSVDVAVPQISVIKIMSSVISLVIGFGVIFQFPILLVFSSKMELVKIDDLKSKRKIVYGALFAFSLLVSPDPSALSEIIVAFSFIVLFEFSLLIAKYF